MLFVIENEVWLLVVIASPKVFQLPPELEIRYSVGFEGHVTLEYGAVLE